MQSQLGIKDRFDRFWTRLSRATPVIGLGASILMLPHRFQCAAADDAAYRELIAKLGAEPLFPHHSVQRERSVAVGEIIGHIIALALGLALWREFTLTQYVVFATWIAAFFTDWIGGKVGLWLFSRRQPSVAEIVDQSVSRGHSESKNPRHS